MTNSRVVAGWRGDLNNSAKNFPVVIPIEAVNGIEVTGFMDNVKFVLANGDDLKVGNLWDANDEEALRAAVRTAQSSEDDQATRRHRPPTSCTTGPTLVLRTESATPPGRRSPAGRRRPGRSRPR